MFHISNAQVGVEIAVVKWRNGLSFRNLLLYTFRLLIHDL